jgi:transketolase
MSSKIISPNQSVRKAFGQTLVELAKTNPNIFVVSMDLMSSIKLQEFVKTYPTRFIECGIAENNAAAIAAGLAKSGKTVFLCSFACFSPAINWAVIRQSICYTNLDVKIVGSHAGLMSEDLGATHQMLEDVALMSTLPNMEVFAPIDAIETQKITTAISTSGRPSYLRLVRPDSPVVFGSKNTFEIGKSKILKTGKDITVIGYGPILIQAFEAQEKLLNISLEIINCSSIKPFDSESILKSLKKTGHLICIEDHQKNGGLGQMVASLVLESKIKADFIHLAVDNQFGQSGRDYKKLYDHYGIGVKDLITAAQKIYGKSI